MVERGYAVNTAMLANVTLGGGRLKPAEALTLWRQTGILPFSYSASNGLYTGGAATPIVPLEGGMGPRVEETMRTFDMLFGLLEKMTGINPVSLGMTPDPCAPVGTTQASMQATANVLRPILDACYELKQSTGTCLMRRIQIGIRTSERVRKAYSGIISPSDMDALRLMEAEGVQYGMTLRAKPDAKMRAKFTEWCALALQNVREQRPGVDLPDVMYFGTALERGEDLYDLIDQMRYIIEKNKQEAEAQSNAISYGNISIDTERFEVTKNGTPVELTLREFELLTYLAKQPEKIISRETLLEKVWGYEYYGDVRTVDVTVSRLREKIEDNAAEPSYIMTKRGFGYYFNPKN
jgi:DNA-binding winged helix-turn-helix (wHTH) protein